MSLVFSVYANSRFTEVYLPEINNADHSVTLRADDLGLFGDLVLDMEVVDNIWYFKPNEAYDVLHGSEPFAGKPLCAGYVLTVTAKEDEMVIILLQSSQNELAAYKKFKILKFSEPITIGKNADSDICCPSDKIISRRHARITFDRKKAYIEDLSTNGTYLGTHRLSGRERLKYGDRINMYGLSVYFLGKYLALKKNDDALSVNYGRLEEIKSLPHIEGGAKKSAVYSETTQVHIAPRSLPDLYEGEEKIENNPQAQEENDRPAWMSVLPSLTMVIPMCLGVLLMGASKLGIMISGGAAVVGAVWAILNYRYSKKSAKKKELRRLQRYEEYLVRRADDIRKKFEFNRGALIQMYPDAEECSKYSETSSELWARRPQNSDFLAIRLGTGDLPFQAKIVAPEHEFSLLDDELAERPAKIARSYQTMKDVPICVDFLNHSVIGVVTDNTENEGLLFVRTILAQIAANHCYTDVKVAAVFDGSRRTSEEWGFVRWLPHNWNEERSMRYFASDSAEADDLFYALTQVLRTRIEREQPESLRREMVLPHFILFVEDPAMLESRMICRYLYEQEKNLGITTVIFSDSYEHLPNACNLVIENTPRFQGTYEIKEGSSDRCDIKFDTASLKSVREMAARMSSMRVSETSYSSDIPNTLTFFEMMKIHQLKELNVLDRWRKNRTYETMRALIGQKAGGVDCYLDIHEKFHGPHGLVAGTTGSGKSETLQTYILSLAINFSPRDVGFFIIDFKGGGMANLFSGLPHLLGQISNLSGNQVRRAMVSIQSENRRRQRLFNDYGVNNINDYTRLSKSREDMVPLPHLLIIIDEFAELKREEPEFMRQLISVAQVGRSLGVHLILATQKPSGTVDDNIWSNTKFKLCLRVADKQDSNDMLHKPDAAYITQTGRGYLQVGNDEIYEQFQSGWSGAAYDANEIGQGQSAVLVDHMGNEQKLVKSLRQKQVPMPSQREETQLEAVTEYLAELAGANSYTIKQQLWMPILPTQLYLEDLDGYSRDFYDGHRNENRKEFSLRAQIGMVDFPEEQQQFPLVLDLASNGHLAVIGSVTSGKSTFLQTAIYSLMCHYSPREVNFYLIDYSSQRLAPFEQAPHVGGVVFEGEDDRLNKLFGLISLNLAERKRLIRGGNYSQFVRVNGYKIPAVVLVIDGYANFREKTDGSFEDKLIELVRDAEGYGIYVIISANGFGSSELQSKISEKMRQGICLEMSDQYGYGEILRHGRFDVRPENNVKGRGLAVVNDRVLEYQTALALKADNDYELAEKISAVCKEMRAHWTGASARRIPEIPEKPTWKLFREDEEYFDEIKKDFLPAAYRQKDASYYGVNLVQTFCYLILGGAASGKSTYLRNLACAAKDFGGRLLFVDTNDCADKKTSDLAGAEYFSSDSDLFEFVKQMILLTNERGKERGRLLGQGLENEEIYAEMKSFDPVFCFISDLSDFLNRIYSNLEGIGKLGPNLEVIFERGKLLNVFFFAALNSQDTSVVADKRIFRSFIREPQGVVLGGEINKQTIFSYQNIRYSEQGKRYRPGTAYAVSEEDNQNMELIVIPQNRGESNL